jgi:hypothetical protein
MPLLGLSVDSRQLRRGVFPSIDRAREPLEELRALGGQKRGRLGTVRLICRGFNCGVYGQWVKKVLDRGECFEAMHEAKWNQAWWEECTRMDTAFVEYLRYRERFVLLEALKSFHAQPVVEGGRRERKRAFAQMARRATESMTSDDRIILERPRAMQEAGEW